MKVVPVRATNPAICQSASRELASGTVLWIGDATVPEFQFAYKYCVDHAAQIALREDVFAAIERPARDVHRIVLARANRYPLSSPAFESLSHQYANARWMDLLGPLCEGIRQSSIPDSIRVAWHRWDQVLPHWLQESAQSSTDGGELEGGGRFAVGSVAIIASNFANAQAYLDLAENLGVTAIWSHAPNAMRMRNIESVWWDDSVADSAEPEGWRDRISTFVAAGRKLRHTWITHSAGLDQRQKAINGGIDTVISKPFRIESLLQTVGASRIARPVWRQAA